MGDKIRIQPAVKKETKNVAVSTGTLLLVMWLVIFLLHLYMPETVKFDYTVFTGGLGGAVIAVLNFFLMGLTVQKVASLEDEKDARAAMKASYSRRLLLQIVWIVVALLVPAVWWVSAILPLLFPSAGIKIKGIIEQRKYNRQEVERKQDGD